MSVEAKFGSAVRVIHSLPKAGPYQPSNSMKLKFYGLYKQATEGKVIGSRPGFWDVISRAKWDAWSKLGDMTKDDAMHHYVENFKEIVKANETMSFSGDPEDYMNTIGPFYEFVCLQGKEMSHIKEKLEAATSSSGKISLGGAKNISSPTTGPQLSEQDDKAYKKDSANDCSPQELLQSNMTDANKKSKNKCLVQLHTETKNPEREQKDVVILSTEAVVTSGTESENYYSGDSDPEIEAVGEERVSLSQATKLRPSVESVAEPSKAIGQPFPASETQFNDSGGPLSHCKSTYTCQHKRQKERLHPEIRNATACRSSAPEIVMAQTMERFSGDVDHILARLRILEAAYATSVEGAGAFVQYSKDHKELNRYIRRNGRGSGHFSLRSVAFIVTWPFFVQLMVKLISWWWRKRRMAVALK